MAVFIITAIGFMEIIDGIVPLLTLILIETILGIDNIIFISIMADKLPPEKRAKLRFWGLALAMIMRLGLLTVIAWIMRLEAILFTIAGNELSGKDLILILGGIFLLYKSTKEIYHNTEKATVTKLPAKGAYSFRTLLIEIIILDMVFSIDSIITAVGLVNEIWIMYTAVVVSVIIMMIAAKPISEFISKHPSFKILALCFLMMIGFSLVVEGLEFEIPKGYIYFAMLFSFIVDVIQMKTLKPVVVEKP